MSCAMNRASLAPGPRMRSARELSFPTTPQNTTPCNQSIGVSHHTSLHQRSAEFYRRGAARGNAAAERATANLLRAKGDFANAKTLYEKSAAQGAGKCIVHELLSPCVCVRACACVHCRVVASSLVCALTCLAWLIPNTKWRRFTPPPITNDIRRCFGHV